MKRPIFAKGGKYGPRDTWVNRPARQPPQFSFIQRVNHLEKREAVEVGVPSANPANAMFTHEDCGMRVVDEITRKVRQFRNDLFDNIRMTVRRNKDAKSR